MLVPALLVAGAANAAEIYNKDGNKLDLYGKMVGRTHSDRNTDDGEKQAIIRRYLYARFGLKGETQINPELTGYGQFEYNLEASNKHNPDQTRLATCWVELQRFWFIRLWS